MVPYVEDGWPVGVTVERIVAPGVSVPGSVEVLGSLPFDLEDPAQRGPDGTNAIVGFGGAGRPSAWDRPAAATDVPVAPRAGRTSAGTAFLVRITPDATRETRVDGFDVEYRLGPFTFTAPTRSGAGQTVVFCGAGRPIPGEDGCGAA